MVVGTPAAQAVVADHHLPSAEELDMADSGKHHLLENDVSVSGGLIAEEAAA